MFAGWHKYVCAVCWGELEECPDGEIRCRKYGSEHSGFVTKTYADIRRKESIGERIRAEFDLGMKTMDDINRELGF